MKDKIVDANFPRTLDQRVYHLGLRAGEVANRIITLGTPSRAHGIASYLDPLPAPFSLTSERGFTTITGRYRGVPVSIVSIGMGYPNADFFVREVRECLNGDMVVVRLGSCGALIDVPVGTVVAPKGSIAVTRNYDFDFTSRGAKPDGSEEPYRTSKPVMADPILHSALVEALKATRPPDITTPIVDHTLNASADSFYSSQGRQTSFPDHNADLIARLKAQHPDLATLEMETFHILHLASCWDIDAHDGSATPPPVQHAATSPSISPTHAPSMQTFIPDVAESSASHTRLRPPPRIRAAAAQMVFAARTSQDFITPEHVASIEAWTGRAVLDALVGLPIERERLHDERGSVWELVDTDMDTDAQEARTARR
ncbi:purine and uridine phosphorylase [Lentinus tigrinus ALCF2SS1-7]|uniref:Purine and uridine phosphorylase n=1 Tax=Lentinus tigrinus ALCF2SS1-6 TaxID=1328759 RepID=A0A5C2RZ09_9APHY|nr:purine and uridine phosphorylase [Lentinus tigrinus ALCF2SS1-6]RPD71093.1 purine and uridine phosphorylase [Lentinus tigrinus ALCF2SS1-7]